MAKQRLGMVGLGVMGQNLALNLASRGFAVAGFDLEQKQADAFAAKSAGQNVLTCRSQAEFLGELERPRRILIMVPAGPDVDAVISTLRPRLDRGDLLMDGGNTWFRDTVRRISELEGSGILYLGVGISGGEEGALHGPSVMPGGNPDAWPLAQPILQAMAAKAEDGQPCCDWVGPGGAGHFVKMVHNGIQYADMQMISDAYWLMHRLLGLSAEEASRVFAAWNESELSSYLVGITAIILAKHDPETGRPLVDLVLDVAEQKGMGKWTAQVSFDLEAAVPTLADAISTRTLSALKRERISAAAVLAGPAPTFRGERTAFLEAIRQALYCSKICAYAQGFQLLAAADRTFHWGLRPGSISSLWRAGCIIRAQLLGKIKAAYDQTPSLANLLLDSHFASVTAAYQPGWRQVVAVAAENGVPVPAFMSALAYYDGYRSALLPANLLQAQRDFFAAHTYQRTDRAGTFHTDWRE